MAEGKIIKFPYFQAPNDIFDKDLDLTALEKLVLLFLYRCGNQGAEAYPGYAGIARKCRVSKTTARTVILSLEKKGFIAVKRRPKANKDNLPNLYVIKHPIAGDDIPISGADTGAIAGDDIPISGADTEKELLKKNSIEKEKNIDQFFESVWLLYPLKVGKGKIKPAQKKKLHQLGHDVIAKCIERYKASKPDWQAYQHGATFFNSGYIDYLDENFKEGVEMNGSSRTGVFKTEGTHGGRTTRKDATYYTEGAEEFYS